MALKREMLKAMGLTEEQVSEIMEAHSETVDWLKSQINEYKADAKKLPSVQKELDQAKTELAEATKEDWHSKYEQAQKDLQEYKENQSKLAAHQAKETAYRDMLKRAGIDDKFMDDIIGLAKVDDVELDSDGKIKGVDKLIEGVKDKYSNFVTIEQKNGVNTPNPPNNIDDKKSAYDKMTLSEKMIFANEHPQEYKEIMKKGE